MTMETLDLIIKVGSAVTATAGIVAVVVAIIKVCRRIITFISSLEKNVNTLMVHDVSQYKAILRLTVTADHMPMSERLLAGKEYVEELGGNGDIKKLYKELQRQCDQASEE